MEEYEQYSAFKSLCLITPVWLKILLSASRVTLSLSHIQRETSCSPLVFVYIVSFFCFSTGFASIRSFKGSRGKDKILDRWHTRERQAFFFGFLFFLFFLFVMESLIYLHIPVSFRLLVAGCVINQNAADDAEIRPFLGRGQINPIPSSIYTYFFSISKTPHNVLCIYQLWHLQYTVYLPGQVTLHWS